MEPCLPGGAAKTARKGCGEFELIVRGVAAHAGLDPGKGASAIHELAHQILAVSRLQDVERGITVNAGLVSGGTRSNVTAAEARATIDVRAVTMADTREVESGMRSLQPVDSRTVLEVTGGFERPPLERSAAGNRLYQMARQVAHDLGRDLAEGAAGGGSDGNFTAALGVPTLDGLGPQGGGAHALDEHVLVSDLPFRTALLAGLLGRLALHIDG
jgi:glutamate carboxypeptidase